MIEPERIQLLNKKSARDGDYVLYWMQASQRGEHNHALEYAIQQANQRNQPLVVVFGLTDNFPEANLRHYAFMLEGLRETQDALRKRGIQLAIRRDSPERAAVEFSEAASLLVTDRGYLRIQRDWRKTVARKARCPVVQVESDIVVPVEIASLKEEYAAATIRPKILKHLNHYLAPVKKTKLKHGSLAMQFDGMNLQDIDAVLAQLDIDTSVPRQGFYLGGTSQARKWLDRFVRTKLDDYADSRNDPSLEIQSNLSPYLHFGQISPVYIAMRVHTASGKNRKAKEAFLEELIVRRELSINFVLYNPYYDSYHATPEWAKETLRTHQKDHRNDIYALKDLENTNTHDPYWNAAMHEMLVTGKMANYMRMYWAKKILEWSPTPQKAFAHVLYLNNKYFLDGRDPNSFAGVAWCFGKHDRPWGERPIFGKVRYMNEGGLRRKFDIDTYVRKIQRLIEQTESKSGT
ncbi:MAG: deoxyribodipyrimidine photo-lyase [bacterium]